MQFIAKNSRLLIYFVTFSVIIVIYTYFSATIPSESLRTIRITQTFGLIALLYLYLALLQTPLYHAFPFLPGRAQWRHARKALGISAWVFAVLHGSNAFFNQLGGFNGIQFLSNTYRVPLVLSSVALLILSVMAVTSLSFLVAKLGSYWKPVHRLVYLAGFLILIHAMMLGTHFHSIHSSIPTVVISLISLLLILQGIRIDSYFQQKLQTQKRFTIVFPLWVAILAIALCYLYTPGQNESAKSLSIHMTHPKPTSTSHSMNMHATNNLQAVKKRYSVSFNTPSTIEPNKETILNFKIFDAASGNPMTIFKTNFEKTSHLVLVDEAFTDFNHIHPNQNKNEFTIAHTFKNSGTYHLYLDFMPLGDEEQVFAFTTQVGKSTTEPVVSTNEQVVFKDENYSTQLNVAGKLSATDLSLGKTKLTFTVQPIDSNREKIMLSPYLGAFGHLVMINSETFEYIHIHPTKLLEPGSTTSEPVIEFQSMPTNSTIRAGTYKLFFQFNHQDNIRVAEFTISITE